MLLGKSYQYSVWSHSINCSLKVVTAWLLIYRRQLRTCIQLRSCTVKKEWVTLCSPASSNGSIDRKIKKFVELITFHHYVVKIKSIIAFPLHVWQLHIKVTPLVSNSYHSNCSNFYTVFLIHYFYHEDHPTIIIIYIIYTAWQI